jgi:hypothetical protein
LRGVDLNHRPLGYELNDQHIRSAFLLTHRSRTGGARCRCSSAGASPPYFHVRTMRPKQRAVRVPERVGTSAQPNSANAVRSTTCNISVQLVPDEQHFIPGEPAFA